MEQLRPCILKIAQFQSSRRLFFKAQTLFSQLSNAAELAKVHYNLGLTYQHLEKWQDALHHSEQALRLFQALQDRDAETKALIALIAHDTDTVDANTHKKYVTALKTLVAQQQAGEFQNSVQDYIAQYCSNFPGRTLEKLLQ
jgi:tetratricopeptide (TPR) repeat protein